MSRTVTNCHDSSHRAPHLRRFRSPLFLISPRNVTQLARCAMNTMPTVMTVPYSKRFFWVGFHHSDAHRKAMPS